MGKNKFKLFKPDSLNKEKMFILGIFILSFCMAVVFLTNVNKAQPKNPLSAEAAYNSMAAPNEIAGSELENLSKVYVDSDTGSEQEAMNEERQGVPEQGDNEDPGSSMSETETPEDPKNPVSEDPETPKNPDERTTPVQSEDGDSDKDGNDYYVIKDGGSPGEDILYDGFFMTTIKNGEVVAYKSYSFSIIQKDHNLTVEDIEIKVNGSKVQGFLGKVLLTDGENTISIKITYSDQTGKKIVVQRDYTVFLNEGDIIITTDLADTSVDNPVFSFNARAKHKDKDIKLKAYLNGEELKGSNGTYTCELREGTNIIRLHASDGNKDKQVTFNVIYQKPAGCQIITDLKSQQVGAPAFSFNAKAVKGDQEIPLEVLLNGKSVEGRDAHYAVSLNKGDNEIVLRAGPAGSETEKQYRIVYVIPVIDGSGEEIDKDSHLPRLRRTDILHNGTIKGRLYTFEIEPRDYKGNKIYAKNIEVKVNDIVVKCIWDDSVKTSYTVKLNPGENVINITLTDAENNSVTYRFIVHSAGANDGDIIGHATFSVEATTIGLGYLIPPTQVELREGEYSAHILINLLEENGFDYKHKGTIGNGFYLAHILLPGLVTNPVIPEELAKRLEDEAGLTNITDPAKYHSNSLGEFDFTGGSGWMYCVNGIYPNLGFDQRNLQDGDVVRIRFTLWYGKDINGGYSMGVGDVENWGDW
jgi:hypothetical protein